MDIELDVTVCSMGFWPSMKNIPGRLPEVLQTACSNYKQFYLHQQSYAQKRKLFWRYDLGQAELTVEFSPSCRKSLIVSTSQMMILLVFNSHKQVTLAQLVALTGIPLPELSSPLLSLCHPDVGVLLKHPSSSY
jgi:hypothetical protein